MLGLWGSEAMPYINQKDRKSIDLNYRLPFTPGELNYKITRELNFYLRTKGLSYNSINDIIGALEAAKMEFYNRVVIKYEESKISVNGDVYSEEFMNG